MYASFFASSATMREQVGCDQLINKPIPINLLSCHTAFLVFKQPFSSPKSLHISSSPG